MTYRALSLNCCSLHCKLQHNISSELLCRTGGTLANQSVLSGLLPSVQLTFLPLQTLRLRHHH